MPEQAKAGDLIPPHALAAERALIGAAIADREVLEAALPIVRSGDFYAHVHETLWEAIVGLHRESRPVDLIALAEVLRARGDLDRVGGFAYLSETLRGSIQTVSSATYYARLVREKARLREAIDLGRTVMALGYDGEADAPEAEARIAHAFTQFLDGHSARNLALAMPDAIAEYDRHLAGSGSLAYYTPWQALNRLTGGFTPDELIVWASDPGVGKSVLLVLLAIYVAMRYGHVAFFATEMGRLKTIARFLATLSGISVRRQRQAADPKQGKPLRPFEQQALTDAREMLEVLPISIFDETMSAEEIVAQCRRLHRRDPLKAVIIDTLGAIGDMDGDTDQRGAGRRAEDSDHRRLKRIVVRLKRAAKDLQVPVHVAHHFNRDQRRAGDRPTMKNLRDGGNLEGWATSIIFPHREIDEDTGEPCHLFIVEKARDGEPGVLPMTFDGARALWLEPGERLPFFSAEPDEARFA